MNFETQAKHLEGLTKKGNILNSSTTRPFCHYTLGGGGDDVQFLCVLRALLKIGAGIEYQNTSKTLGGVNKNQRDNILNSRTTRPFWHYKPPQVGSGGDDVQNLCFKGFTKNWGWY